MLSRWLAERTGDLASDGTVVDNGSGLSRRSRISALLRPLPLIDGLITATIVAPTVPDAPGAEDPARLLLEV